MSQTWLRVETDRPLRHLAPVSSPPPTLEGIDKVFEHPFELRSFSSAAPATKSSQHVRLFRLANEDKLGTVSIACGGWDVRPSDTGSLATFAIHALRSSSKKGACELIDSCASQAPSTAHASTWYTHSSTTGFRQASAHGEAGSNNQRFLPSRSGKAHAHRISSPSTGNRPGESDDGALFWEAQKSNTHHFASITSAVPLSPLLCIALPVDATASVDVLISGHGWAIGVPSAAVADDAVNKGSSSMMRKERLPSLQKHLKRASRVYRGLFLCVARMLRSAFPESAIGNDLTAAISLVESTHASLFFAFVTLSGVSLCSSTFFSRTTHWEKVLIASYAMDKLVPKAATLDATINPDASQSIQVHELPLRLSRLGQGTVANIVVMSIGSVVAVVLAFPSQAPPYTAASFSKFVREKLMTRETISPAMDKRMRRSIGLTTVPTADLNIRQLPTTDDSQTPAFPGLQGRGLTSIAHHVTICTAQPGEVGLIKLMDDLSTSEDDGTTGMCGCTGQFQVDRAARQSEHIVELVAHDALEGLLLRYASRMRRIDETAFAALRVHHVAALTALLVSSPTSVPFFQLNSSPHRVMPEAYKAFEVCWWRHLAAQPLGKMGIATATALPTLLRPVVDAASNALLLAQGEQGPAEPCLSCVSVDSREVVHVVDPDHHAGPMSVVTHAVPAVLATEPHSALVTSATLAQPVDCSQWTDEFHHLGFRAPVHHRLVEMTEEDWRLAKGLLRHFRSLLHLGMLLQHATR